jgi:hypothetical protein
LKAERASGRRGRLDGARRDFALADFFEGDVDETHARFDLDERTARGVELPHAARDEVDQNFVVGDGFAGFFEQHRIHVIEFGAETDGAPVTLKNKKSTEGVSIALWRV